MNQGRNRGYSATEKTEMWDRWQRGEALTSIGRAFGKASSSVYFRVAPYGGSVRRLDVALGWRCPLGNARRYRAVLRRMNQ